MKTAPTARQGRSGLWDGLFLARFAPIHGRIAPILAWFVPIHGWFAPILGRFAPLDGWFAPILGWSAPNRGWMALRLAWLARLPGQIVPLTGPGGTRADPVGPFPTMPR